MRDTLDIRKVTVLLRGKGEVMAPRFEGFQSLQLGRSLPLSEVKSDTSLAEVLKFATCRRAGQR